jgi:hypothetical protein
MNTDEHTHYTANHRFESHSHRHDGPHKHHEIVTRRGPRMVTVYMPGNYSPHPVSTTQENST